MFLKLKKKKLRYIFYIFLKIKKYIYNFFNIDFFMFYMSKIMKNLIYEIYLCYRMTKIVKRKYNGINNKISKEKFNIKNEIKDIKNIIQAISIYQEIYVSSIK